ncbi:MAG: PilZ domain-containing protein [Deltaproteobacteria bacterium]|nr:PilZ domain-containing protein [Deltaproteobacteria bacterium]
MSKTAWTEKRAHRRSLAAIPAWVASDGAHIDASTRDISIDGVQVEAKAEVKEGERVELALQVPGRAEPQVLQEEVAWKRDDALGVVFDKLSDDDEGLIQLMVHGELGIDEDPAYIEEEPTRDL